MWCHFLALTVLLTGVSFIVLCKFCSAFKYYVKFTLYYGFMTIFSIVIIFLSLPSPKDTKNFRYMAFFFGICRYLLGIRWELRGKVNLRSDSPFIIVCNHQSSLDFVSATNVMPPARCTYLSKKELLYTGPFGLAAWICGAIFIDRRRHENAVNTMMNTAKIIHKKNLVVWIYPEGTRSSGKEMLPFKTGAFHLAVQAQVPVVPVVNSAYHFYDKESKRFDTGKFIITALPPVQTLGLTAEDVPTLTENVQQQMMKVFKDTSSEGNNH